MQRNDLLWVNELKITSRSLVKTFEIFIYVLFPLKFYPFLQFPNTERGEREGRRCDCTGKVKELGCVINVLK